MTSCERKMLLLGALGLLASTVTSEGVAYCEKFVCAKPSEDKDFEHTTHWKCGINKTVGERQEIHLRPCGKISGTSDFNC